MIYAYKYGFRNCGIVSFRADCTVDRKNGGVRLGFELLQQRFGRIERISLGN